MLRPLSLAMCLLAGCTTPASLSWLGGDDATTVVSATDDEPVEPAPEGSGCDTTATTVRCPYQTFAVDPGELDLGPFDARRKVHVAVPPGTAPDAGWPVAFLFQGSFFTAELFFRGDEGQPFGGLYQAQVTDALLAAGFAVVAPETHLGGNTFWDTNVVPYSLAWTTSPDHRLMLTLFDAIAAGDLGPLDPDRMVAAGISSGGYMTSRMAVAYPGRFRALAIHSAAYATCSGLLCVIPDLPANHPPTLFLHGTNDVVVPMRTALAYESALTDQGTPTDFVQEAEGHAWLPAAPEAIAEWFTTTH